MNPTIEKLGRLLTRVQRNRAQPRRLGGTAIRTARPEAAAKPPARTPLEIAVEDQLLDRPTSPTTPPAELISATRISEPPPAPAPQPMTPQRIQPAAMSAPVRPVAVAVSPVAKAAPTTFGQLVTDALSLRLKS